MPAHQASVGGLRGLLEHAAGATLPDWASASAAIEVRHVAAGEPVFRQDEPHPFVYLVSRGLVKLLYLDEAGNEWIKSFSQEGRYFASISALTPGGSTSFMAVAIEPTELERMPYAALAALAEQHRPWARAVSALTMAFAARKEQRERELLTLSPPDRYLAFRRTYPDLESRLTQKDIARYLGLTPVGLNRIIRRLSKRLQ